MTRRKITTQNLIQVLLNNNEHVTPHVCQVYFCLLNATSGCDVKQAGKATVMCDLIEDTDLDIFAITVPTTPSLLVV